MNDYNLCKNCLKWIKQLLLSSVSNPTYCWQCGKKIEEGVSHK